MIYTLEIFESIPFEKYDINLTQKDVSGGKISIEQIDEIKKYSDVKSIVISGLEDDTKAKMMKVLINI